jgi:hypothetical protein
MRDTSINWTSAVYCSLLHVAADDNNISMVPSYVAT